MAMRIKLIVVVVVVLVVVKQLIHHLQVLEYQSLTFADCRLHTVDLRPLIIRDVH